MSSGFVEVPGLREVVERTEGKQEAAFFAGVRRIGSFRAMPVTPKRFAFLIQSGNSFVTGRPIRLIDVPKLLWVLHPKWRPARSWRQDWIAFRVRCMSDDALHSISSELIDFLDETFELAPVFFKKKSGSSGPGNVCAGYLAHITHTVCASYGMNWREVAETPLSVIFQWIRLINCEKLGKDYHELTPEDRHVMEWRRMLKKKEGENGVR